MERASEEKRVQMVGKAYVSFPGSYVYLRRSRQVYDLPVLPPRQPDNYIWSAVVVAVVLAVEQDISYLCHWRLYACSMQGGANEWNCWSYLSINLSRMISNIRAVEHISLMKR